jgi:hypothetical protein
MFTTPYPTIAERQAFEARALRMRGEVVAGFLRDLARWVSAAAR